MKSDASDELINTYVMRPAAGILVRMLYHTSVTPNHLTLSAIFCGILAAGLYAFNLPLLTILAGISLSVKDLLDSADGQCARAKGIDSRAGRFLDSIGDYLVNLFVFAAIGFAHHERGPAIPLLAFAGFLGTTLRVSYHVFYQTSYLHLHGVYPLNRIVEDVRVEDLSGDRVTVQLQKIFILLYGWQDRIMVRLDRWCKRGLPSSRDTNHQWYADRTGLRISGFLGLGTELAVLTLFSVLNELEMYLYLNSIFLNLIWISSILYRRNFLSRRIDRMIREPVTPGRHSS